MSAVVPARAAVPRDGLPAAPSISFVLAVHGEQAYLRECATSVLEQRAGGDLELIAVDDASPDHAPELLDQLAARDARVRVEHLPERSGPGAARNVGLELARGDYVWFLSTTDRLAPGALAATAWRLRAARPDVLLVHHLTVGTLGDTQQGPHRSLLARLDDGSRWTVEQRPAATDLAPVAWNKLFRRELLERLALRFENGGHGELGVTWPALLIAEAIAASAAPAYIRRRPANAVTDRLVEGSPFDVFARYEDVFALVERHREVTDARLRLLAAAMLRQELSLLRQVPATDRPEFLHRMSQAWARHCAPDEPFGTSRLSRVRASLVERDGYRALAVLEDALDAARALRGQGGTLIHHGHRATRRVRRASLEASYRARRRAPLDPDLAVFAAYWYRGYACNPRAIFEKLRELVPSVRGVWVVKPSAAATVPAGVEYVLAGSREYYDVLARASYFVNNVNFPDHLVKRDGTVHVMTHHGTPLKWMGLDLRHTPVAGRQMDFAALLRRCERWDYSISSNSFSTLVWERVYPTRYESLEVGYPRNDVLVRATAEDVRQVRAQLDIPREATVVLYAPTHRDYQSDYVPFLDLAAVAEGLGPDHVVLARLHYFYDRDPHLRELHRQGRVRDVARHPSVEELCLASDVLVTDYSSIMFDYALLDRPIVVHAPDWDVYRAMRGTYLDVMEEGPGMVIRSEAELVDGLRSRAAWSADAARGRAAFRDRFCTLDDGHAAERVVRRVWLGEELPATARVRSLARRP